MVIHDENMWRVLHGALLKHWKSDGQVPFCRQLYQPLSIATDGYKSTGVRPYIQMFDAKLYEVKRRKGFKMSYSTKVSTGLLVAVLTAGAALADDSHHQAGGGESVSPNVLAQQMAGTGGPGMMMGGGMMEPSHMAEHLQMMHGMMRMMMQMHSGMMSGNGITMGANTTGQGMFPMMGGNMMSMFDMDGNGAVSSEEAHEGLQSMLWDYDVDGNGALSIDEFASLHAKAMRETMVDRFQMLDADGDGQISQGEMVAPADNMAQGMTANPGMMTDQDN